MYRHVIANIVLVRHLLINKRSSPFEEYIYIMLRNLKNNTTNEVVRNDSHHFIL